MSFKCDYCENPQEAGVTPTRRVVSTRPNKDTHGTQIVREMNLCSVCDPIIAEKLDELFRQIEEDERKYRNSDPLTAPLGSIAQGEAQ